MIVTISEISNKIQLIPWQERRRGHCMTSRPPPLRNEVKLTFNSRLQKIEKFGAVTTEFGR